MYLENQENQENIKELLPYLSFVIHLIFMHLIDAFVHIKLTLGFYQMEIGVIEWFSFS